MTKFQIYCKENKINIKKCFFFNKSNLELVDEVIKNWKAINDKQKKRFLKFFIFAEKSFVILKHSVQCKSGFIFKKGDN